MWNECAFVERETDRDTRSLVREPLTTLQGDFESKDLIPGFSFLTPRVADGGPGFLAVYFSIGTFPYKLSRFTYKSMPEQSAVGSIPFLPQPHGAH